MPAITTSKIVKKYGKVTAVGGVSLDIREGETFGLLGPNGAGKTAMISMLAATVKPSRGTSAHPHVFERAAVAAFSLAFTYFATKAFECIKQQK
ncbi:MAG: ATP-binding cassette domain-containing protein [Candidatus Micrarchaeota archaeon]